MKKTRLFLRGKKHCRCEEKEYFSLKSAFLETRRAFVAKKKNLFVLARQTSGTISSLPSFRFFFTRRGHKILHAPTAPLSTASFLRIYSRFFFFLFFRWFRHITEASNAYKSRESSRRAGARAPDAAAAAAAAAGTANGGLSLDEPSASASKPAARSHSFNDAQGSSSSSAAAAAAGGGSAAASAAAAGDDDGSIAKKTGER